MQTRDMINFHCSHRDDEGEVDADGEVGDREHVNCRQLDKL